MRALEEMMARGGRIPTPPVVEPPVIGATPVAAPVAEQEMWMRLIERYQKLRAPEFHGGPDPMVADKWKEEVGSILDLMGVDPWQRQRLAAFSLKGDASKWYRLHFSAEERLTITWDEFVWRFDLQFISSAAKAGKEMELISLEQGELSVAEYESKFVSLLHFTGMFQSEDRQARMFERGLRPQLRRYVLAQRFRCVRDVADAAIAHELDFAAQKGKETATRAAAAKAPAKDKGKRPFAAVGQEESRQPGPIAPAFTGTCFNCGKVGHRQFNCRQRRRGSDERGPDGQDHGHQQLGYQQYPQHQQQDQQLRLLAPPAAPLEEGRVHALYEVTQDATPLQAVQPAHAHVYAFDPRDLEQ